MLTKAQLKILVNMYDGYGWDAPRRYAVIGLLKLWRGWWTYHPSKGPLQRISRNSIDALSLGGYIKMLTSKEKRAWNKRNGYEESVNVVPIVYKLTERGKKEAIPIYCKERIEVINQWMVDAEATYKKSLKNLKSRRSYYLRLIK